MRKVLGFKPEGLTEMGRKVSAGLSDVSDPHMTENLNLWGRGQSCCFSTNTDHYYLPVKDGKKNL